MKNYNYNNKIIFFLPVFVILMALPSFCVSHKPLMCSHSDGPKMLAEGVKAIGHLLKDRCDRFGCGSGSIDACIDYTTLLQLIYCDIPPSWYLEGFTITTEHMHSYEHAALFERLRPFVDVDDYKLTGTLNLTFSLESSYCHCQPRVCDFSERVNLTKYLPAFEPRYYLSKISDFGWHDWVVSNIDRGHRYFDPVFARVFNQTNEYFQLINDAVHGYAGSYFSRAFKWFSFFRRFATNFWQSPIGYYDDNQGTYHMFGFRFDMFDSFRDYQTPGAAASINVGYIYWWDFITYFMTGLFGRLFWLFFGFFVFYIVMFVPAFAPYTYHIVAVAAVSYLLGGAVVRADDFEVRTVGHDFGPILYLAYLVLMVCFTLRIVVWCRDNNRERYFNVFIHILLPCMYVVWFLMLFEPFDNMFSNVFLGFGLDVVCPGSGYEINHIPLFGRIVTYIVVGTVCYLIFVHIYIYIFNVLVEFDVAWFSLVVCALYPVIMSVDFTLVVWMSYGHGAMKPYVAELLRIIPPFSFSTSVLDLALVFLLGVFQGLYRRHSRTGNLNLSVRLFLLFWVFACSLFYVHAAPPGIEYFEVAGGGGSPPPFGGGGFQPPPSSSPTAAPDPMIRAYIAIDIVMKVITGASILFIVYLLFDYWRGGGTFVVSINPLRQYPRLNARQDPLSLLNEARNTEVGALLVHRFSRGQFYAQIHEETLRNDIALTMSFTDHVDNIGRLIGRTTRNFLERQTYYEQYDTLIGPRRGSNWVGYFLWDSPPNNRLRNQFSINQPPHVHSRIITDLIPAHRAMLFNAAGHFLVERIWSVVQSYFTGQGGAAGVRFMGFEGWSAIWNLCVVGAGLLNDRQQTVHAMEINCGTNMPRRRDMVYSLFTPGIFFLPLEYSPLSFCIQSLTSMVGLDQYARDSLYQVCRSKIDAAISALDATRIETIAPGCVLISPENYKIMETLVRALNAPPAGRGRGGGRGAPPPPPPVVALPPNIAAYGVQQRAFAANLNGVMCTYLDHTAAANAVHTAIREQLSQLSNIAVFDLSFTRVAATLNN